MGFFLVDVGFLNITLWDILDIAIVNYLFYRVYKLLRGSIAFNIFTGLLLLYAIWWIVNALKMELLSTILSQFVSVGVIMLIIIFQPEMRKFLLEIGRTAIGNRLEFLWKWLNIATTGGQEKIAIVSGDDGSISTAYKGYLAHGISDDELERFIIAHT